MRGIHVKKKMLYMLLIPYLLAGIAAAIFLGYKYNDSVAEIRQKHYEENETVLNKVNREVDYLISDIENMVVEIEFNNRFGRLLTIGSGTRTGKDNYSIAMALRDLRSIKKYNHLMEDIILYYRKDGFFLNSFSLRTELGIYEDYEDNQSVEYQEWQGCLTGQYPQGHLLTIGEAVYYIVTVPFNEEVENCNVIVKINSKGFYEVLNDYNIINEGAVYLLDYDMEHITANAIGSEIFLSEEAELRIIANVESDNFNMDLMDMDGITYMASYIRSGQTGLTYVLLTSQGPLKTLIRYVTTMYLGGGILFALLLFLGLYGVAVNYRNIQAIIDRLVKSNVHDQAIRYTEFDYINSALSAMEEKMQSQENAVLDSCIRKAVYGLMEEESSEYLSLSRQHRNLCLGQSMIAIFEHESEYDLDGKEIKLNLFILGNILRDIFEESVESWALPVYNWQVVTLNWCGEGSMDPEYVLSGLEKAQQFLREYLDLWYTIGLSCPATGMKEFARAYKEAMTALEEKQVIRDGQVICFNSLKEEWPSFEYTEAMDKQLTNYIRLGDEEKASGFIEEIYDQVFHRNPISAEAGKLLMLDLIKTVNEVGRDLGGSRVVDAADVLKKKYKANVMKNNILETVAKLCSKSREQVDSVANRKKQIKQFIESHYKDPNLNVAMIAEEFHLNSSYLSRFFKEETGENLLNYINRCRIARVKELLIHTDDTIAVISSETGFLTAAALNRTFKKYEGITPGQFKTINQSEKRQR